MAHRYRELAHDSWINAQREPSSTQEDDQLVCPDRAGATNGQKTQHVVSRCCVDAIKLAGLVTTISDEKVRRRIVPSPTNVPGTGRPSRHATDGHRRTRRGRVRRLHRTIRKPVEVEPPTTRPQPAGIWGHRWHFR